MSTSVDASILYDIASQGWDYHLASGGGSAIASGDLNYAWQITNCGLGSWSYIADTLSSVCLWASSDTSVGTHACSLEDKIWSIVEDQTGASLLNSPALGTDAYLWLNDTDYRIYTQDQSVPNLYAANYQFTLEAGSSVEFDICSVVEPTTTFPPEPTPTPFPDDTSPSPTPTPEDSSTDEDFWTVLTAIATDDSPTGDFLSTGSPTSTPTGTPGNFDDLLASLSTMTLPSATIQTPSGAGIPAPTTGTASDRIGGESVVRLVVPSFLGVVMMAGT